MSNTKKSSKTKITRKKIIGGNINNQRGLDKILSIGYEVESTNLVKLTESELDNTILYNSDSARKDMNEFKKLENYGQEEDEDEEEDDELEEDEDEDEEESVAESVASSIDAYIEERMAEQSTAKMYKYDNVENKEDPGSEYNEEEGVFHITNDIAKPKFNRKLKELCKDIVVTEDNSIIDIKDKLYKYKENTEEKKEYEINFKFKETTEQELYNFTNVEWVVTYYKPTQSNNIILDTFLNMIKNIVHHIESFSPIPGQFIFKNPTTSREIEVPGTLLYKSPLPENSTLYYLQTDQVQTNQVNQINSFDNICSKIQMTFSAKAEDIIDVMLQITKDYTGFSHAIPEIETDLIDNENIIIKIKTCAEKLYDYLTVSNILTRDEKIKLRNKDKQNQIKQLKTYIFLILFKLNRFYYFMFYNDLVKTGKKRNYNYLKDLLYFNSRHTNHVLYTEIKKIIKELLELQGEDDTKAIQIIKQLILQPDILTEYLIEADFKTPEFKDLIDTTTIFSRDFSIDKETDSYGDPTFSLNSYFDFFEDPVDNEKNKKLDGITIKYYDWLEYAEHDIYSANMDLKGDVVLLECRFFQDILTSYFYSIGDEKLRTQMTNGPCNIISGKMGNPNNGALSIGDFKSIIEIPAAKFLEGGSNKKHKQSSKNRKTKKHKQSKQSKTKKHNQSSKKRKTKK